MFPIAYRLHCKLAGVTPRWFADAPGDWPRRQRLMLADALTTATWNADQGATRNAHRADCNRMAIFASCLRSDMTPAAVVQYLDGLTD